MEYKDYYAILGVPKNADEKAIKSAYRKLARTHHPDVNPDKPEAEARFKEINEAYAVLSDGEKRKMYDKFGAEWEDYQRAGFGPNDAPMRGRAAPSGQRGSTRTMTPEEFQEVFGRGFGRSAPGGFSSSFGGSGVLNGTAIAQKEPSHAQPFSISIRLAPLAVQIFEGENPPKEKVKAPAAEKKKGKK